MSWFSACVGRPATIIVYRCGSNAAAAVARSRLTVLQSFTMCCCQSAASAAALSASAAAPGMPAAMRLHRTKSAAVCHRSCPTAGLSKRRPSEIRCAVWRTHGGFSAMADALQGAHPPPTKKLSRTSNARPRSLGQCTMLCVLQACVHNPTSMGDRLNAQGP